MGGNAAPQAPLRGEWRSKWKKGCGAAGAAHGGRLNTCSQERQHRRRVSSQQPCAADWQASGGGGAGLPPPLGYAPPRGCGSQSPLITHVHQYCDQVKRFPDEEVGCTLSGRTFALTSALRIQRRRAGHTGIFAGCVRPQREWGVAFLGISGGGVLPLGGV
eukprot:gene7624-biopygen13604